MSKFLDRARFALDHRWAPRHMSAYLDDELGAGGRARIERHVGECTECRRVLAGLRAVLGALSSAPAPSADGVRIAASVRARLREPPAGG